MTPGISWWVLALAIGVTSPLWLRALVHRWETRTRQRTERLLARAAKSRDALPPA